MNRYTTKIPAFQLECGHRPRENAQIVELFCYIPVKAGIFVVYSKECTICVSLHPVLYNYYLHNSVEL